MILAAGFALRWYLGDLTSQGDIGAFRSWMESSVKLGISESYVRQVSSPWVPTYPPVAVYMLYAAGRLYQLIVSPGFQIIDPVYMLYTKLPSMLSDVLTALVLSVIVARMRSRRAALLAAAVYLVQPAVLYDSTFWGQFDAPYTLLIVFALASAVIKLPVFAGVFLTLACLTKIQAAVFAPVVLLLLPWKPRPLVRWLVASLGIVAASLIPFVLTGSLEHVLRVLNVGGIMGQSHLSWNAYNLWWLIHGTGAWYRTSHTVLFAGLTEGQFGIILFLTLYVAVLLRLRVLLHSARKTSERFNAVFHAATVVVLGMFMLGPEMHERYLFPFLALGLPVAFMNRRLAIAYVIASFAFMFNLMAVFQYEPFWKYFRPLDDVSRFIALLQVATFVWFTVSLFTPERFSSTSRLRGWLRLGRFWPAMASAHVRKANAKNGQEGLFDFME